MDPALIQSIDPRWNHYNMVREDTRLIHFSHVREQPWKRPEHPMTALWEEWLQEAMSAGYVGRGDILKAVSMGRIHPHFLRHVLQSRLTRPCPGQRRPNSFATRRPNAPP